MKQFIRCVFLVLVYGITTVTSDEDRLKTSHSLVKTKKNIHDAHSNHDSVTLHRRFVADQNKKSPSENSSHNSIKRHRSSRKGRTLFRSSEALHEHHRNNSLLFKGGSNKKLINSKSHSYSANKLHSKRSNNSIDGVSHSKWNSGSELQYNLRSLWNVSSQPHLLESMFNDQAGQQSVYLTVAEQQAELRRRQELRRKHEEERQKLLDERRRLEQERRRVEEDRRRHYNEQQQQQQRGGQHQSRTIGSHRDLRSNSPSGHNPGSHTRRQQSHDSEQRRASPSHQSSQISLPREESNIQQGSTRQQLGTSSNLQQQQRSNPHQPDNTSTSQTHSGQNLSYRPLLQGSRTFLNQTQGSGYQQSSHTVPNQRPDSTSNQGSQALSNQRPGYSHHHQSSGLQSGQISGYSPAFNQQTGQGDSRTSSHRSTYPGFRTQYEYVSQGQWNPYHDGDSFYNYDQHDAYSTCPDTGVELRINGVSCQEAVQQFGSSLCYTHEYTSRQCCEVCRPRKQSSRIGCEYGDHAEQCSSISPSDCYSVRNRQTCCETCERMRRSGAPSGCEYGDMTPRCESVRQNPGLCYRPDNQRICCDTCSQTRNVSNPGCPWGDYDQSFCQLFDEHTSSVKINCYSPQRRRYCCQACERLKQWLPSDLPSDCQYGDRPVIFSTTHYGRLNCSNILNYFNIDECRLNPAVYTNCCYTCRRHLGTRG